MERRGGPARPCCSLHQPSGRGMLRRGPEEAAGWGARGSEAAISLTGLDSQAPCPSERPRSLWGSSATTFSAHAQEDVRNVKERTAPRACLLSGVSISHEKCSIRQVSEWKLLSTRAAADQVFTPTPETGWCPPPPGPADGLVRLTCASRAPKGTATA